MKERGPITSAYYNYHLFRATLENLGMTEFMEGEAMQIARAKISKELGVDELSEPPAESS